MKVLVIIPCYNEEESLKRTVEDLKEKILDDDYLIVNDGSTDATLKICEKNGYSYVNLVLNLGIGGAMQAGYRYAVENDYDIAIQLDGDGQHDPEYIKGMLLFIETKRADIVIGSRFMNKEGFQSTGVRRVGIKFLNVLIRLCSGVKILDVTSGFRAVNRKYIEFFANSYAQDYPEPESIMDAALNKAKIMEIPVIMHERKDGKSSIHSLKPLYYMLKVSMAILLHRFIASKRGLKKT